MKNLTSLKVEFNCRNDKLTADVNMIPIFKSGHLENLKELVLYSCKFFGIDECGLPPEWQEINGFRSGDKYFKFDVAEAIKAIDEGCPNLVKLDLSNFYEILKFDNGRIVYCDHCEVYHLKAEKCGRKHRGGRSSSLGRRN